jgi:hypothetical protein
VYSPSCQHESDVSSTFSSVSLIAQTEMQK